MGRRRMGRFVLEIIFDESYFEKVGSRKIFRYRTKKEIVLFCAKSDKDAKITAKKRIVKTRSVIDYRIYKLTAL